MGRHHESFEGLCRTKLQRRWAGELTQWVRMGTVLTEGQRSVPSTHNAWFTAPCTSMTYNSNSKGSHTSVLQRHSSSQDISIWLEIIKIHLKKCRESTNSLFYGIDTFFFLPFGPWPFSFRISPLDLLVIWLSDANW